MHQGGSAVLVYFVLGYVLYLFKFTRNSSWDSQYLKIDVWILPWLNSNNLSGNCKPQVSLFPRVRRFFHFLDEGFFLPPLSIFPYFFVIIIITTSLSGPPPPDSHDPTHPTSSWPSYPSPPFTFPPSPPPHWRQVPMGLNLQSFPSKVSTLLKVCFILHFEFFFFHLSSHSPPNSLHNRESYFSSSSLKARAHGLDPSTSSKESNQILNHIALFFGSLRMREHYVGKIWTCAVCSHLTKFIFNLCEWCQVILSLKGKLW